LRIYINATSTPTQKNGIRVGSPTLACIGPHLWALDPDETSVVPPVTLTVFDKGGRLRRQRSANLTVKDKLP